MTGVSGRRERRLSDTLANRYFPRFSTGRGEIGIFVGAVLKSRSLQMITTAAAELAVGGTGILYACRKDANKDPSCIRVEHVSS